MKNLHCPASLDWRASNALLIASSRAAMERGHRAVQISDQLMRASAKLMPRSSLKAPPRQTPNDRDWRATADEVARGQANAERRATEALRQMGYLLRSHMEEVVIASQETRRQSRQIRMQSGVLLARSRRVCWDAGDTAARQPTKDR